MTLKGWRTIAANALVVVAGVFAFLDSVSGQFSQFIPLQYAAGAAIIIGCVNVALRIITTTAWGEKE